MQAASNPAGRLHAVVLADLFGLHINTAVKWVDEAAGNWATYAAARSASP